MNRRLLLLLGPAMFAISLLAIPSPAAAQGFPDGSTEADDSTDIPVEEDDGACASLPWGIESLCDGVGSALAWGVQPVVAGGAQMVLHEMVAFVVDGAGWLLERVAAFLDTSTRPQLTASWFERAYQDMAVVAVFGLLPFLLLAIIQGIVRQDPGMLLRAAFGYVPLAAIGTAAGVVVVDLLVQLTDVMTAWIGRSLGADLADFATSMGEALASLPAGSGGPVAGLAALLAAGVMAFAAFAIWLELLLRQAAIYVAVLFLPLGFMAMVWPATAHWLRRLVQGLVAIILSKFVIVAVMALAAAALSGQGGQETDAGEGGGFGVVLAGASMLAMAALAPYVLLRLIPVFEAGLSGELEGTYRRPTAAVESPTAGSHVLQTVRNHVGGAGGSRGTTAEAGYSGRDGGANGGPAGGSGPTPAGGAAQSTATPAAGAGPSGGTGSSAGGGTGSAGAGAAAGVVAAGVGTVAAGAGGAKKAAEHLQAHGAEQRSATTPEREASGVSPPPRERCHLVIPCSSDRGSLATAAWWCHLGDSPACHAARAGTPGGAVMDTVARRYEFGAAAEDHTVVLGLRAGQLGVLGVALLVAVAIVRADGSAGGFGTAIGVVAVAGVVAFWPIAGRTMEQWAPTVARWVAIRAMRRDRHLSPAPLLGHDPNGEALQHPPPTLTDVRLLVAPVGAAGRDVGVVHDRRTGTYAAVLAVRGRSFQLADTPEKQRRLAAWGGVLAGLARASSSVHRLQWIERTVPEDSDVMGRYLAEAVRVPRQHPTLASYLELVDRAGPAAPQHETLLVVAISATRARRAIKQAGGGDAGAAQVLLREVLSVQRTLTSADIVVDGMLTPRSLAGALRSAFDPSARIGLARRAAATGEATGVEAGTHPANAWPLATETTWATYRSADVWHATYWVAQWPRSPVGPDFLAPLLLGVGGMRSIAVTMEPISPLRAHREVEHAVLKGLADEELRSRAGFTSTARRRRAQETAARREQELADGHADYRLAGYLTVTAASLEDLDASCGEVEQAAQQSSLELRRLDGEQDVAFTWTLPLARGLR